MQNADLVNFVEYVSGESHLRVQDDLGGGFVRLRAAEAQRRQAQQDIRSYEDVVLELLRNSRDAHARSIFVATWKENDIRHLTIIDDGDGIPQSHHDLVFEPFVTSKLDSFHSDRWGVHGRGMALYSIKENVDEVKIAASAPKLGSVFVVEAAISRLTEKRDQSSLPCIIEDESGAKVLRGPHNIVRTVLEFAIDERDRISVYFGSPTEIAATLFSLGSKAISRSKVVFDSSQNLMPYMLRFAYCLDPKSVAELSCSLGLPMSERSARRIIDEEIKPVESLITQFFSPKPVIVSQIAEHSESKSTITDKNSPDLEQKTRKVSFSQDELENFQNLIKASYRELAEAYYLDPEIDISIKNTKAGLQILIPVLPAQNKD